MAGPPSGSGSGTLSGSSPAGTVLRIGRRRLVARPGPRSASGLRTGPVYCQSACVESCPGELTALDDPCNGFRRGSGAGSGGQAGTVARRRLYLPRGAAVGPPAQAAVNTSACCSGTHAPPSAAVSGAGSGSAFPDIRLWRRRLYLPRALVGDLACRPAPDCNHVVCGPAVRITYTCGGTDYTVSIPEKLCLFISALDGSFDIQFDLTYQPSLASGGCPGYWTSYDPAGIPPAVRARFGCICPNVAFNVCTTLALEVFFVCNGFGVHLDFDDYCDVTGAGSMGATGVLSEDPFLAVPGPTAYIDALCYTPFGQREASVVLVEGPC